MKCTWSLCIMLSRWFNLFWNRRLLWIVQNTSAVNRLRSVSYYTTLHYQAHCFATRQLLSNCCLVEFKSSRLLHKMETVVKSYCQSTVWVPLKLSRGLVVKRSLVQFPLSTCRSVLGQGNEPLIAPEVLVGTSHGGHRHQCKGCWYCRHDTQHRHQCTVCRAACASDVTHCSWTVSYTEQSKYAFIFRSFSILFSSQ